MGWDKEKSEAVALFSLDTVLGIWVYIIPLFLNLYIVHKFCKCSFATSQYSIYKNSI